MHASRRSHAPAPPHRLRKRRRRRETRRAFCHPRNTAEQTSPPVPSPPSNYHSSVSSLSERRLIKTNYAALLEIAHVAVKPAWNIICEHRLLSRAKLSSIYTYGPSDLPSHFLSTNSSINLKFDPLLDKSVEGQIVSTSYGQSRMCAVERFLCVSLLEKMLVKTFALIFHTFEYKFIINIRLLREINCFFREFIVYFIRMY